MNTKYNIGDKVWIPIYKNYRKCKIFEIAPIRNCFWGDNCLLAYPYELTIERIRMSCKGLKYGIKVNQSANMRRYGIDQYLIWATEDDIFDSKEELEEEYEIQKEYYLDNWRPYSYNYEFSCDCCCNCKCK